MAGGEKRVGTKGGWHLLRKGWDAIFRWISERPMPPVNHMKAVKRGEMKNFCHFDTNAQIEIWPVWAKQLTRLPCLVVYVKFQFVYTTKSKIGSQFLLASTSSHVQLWRGSEKVFNECLEVSNVFSTAALVQPVVIWHKYFISANQNVKGVCLDSVIASIRRIGKS